jgi:iron complex outermembrane recepter protein
MSINRKCTASRLAALLATTFLASAADAQAPSTPASQAVDESVVADQSQQASGSEAEEVASEGGIEEIYVTARKRDESIIEAPLTITAVTSEMLEVRGIEDRRDLNRFTPGFKAQPQNTSGATRLINSYDMRGLGAVNLFWSGVPLGGGDIPEMLDLERVEVLKGPQNAYFGRSTFSGAINFLPKMADFDREGYAEVDVGTFGNRNAKAGFQTTLIDDLLAVRVAADYRRAGGQYENFGYGGKLGKQQTVGGAGSLLFTPTDQLRIRAYGSYWEVNDGPNAIAYLQPADYNCNGGGAPAGTLNFFCGPIKRAPANRISQLTEYPDAVFNTLLDLATKYTVGRDFVEKKNGLKRQGMLAHLFADYELPEGVTASFVLAYNGNKAAQIFDYGSQFYTNPATFNPSITTYKFEDKYGEFRVQSDGERRLRGMFGISYIDSEQVIQSVLVRSGVPSISFPPTIQYSETAGVFASLSFDLFDSLTLTAEGRYQEDVVGRKTLIGTTWQDLAGDTTSFVPRAIVQWHVRDGLEVFASYSLGSRPGSLNTGFLSLPEYAQAQVREQGDQLGFQINNVVPEQKLVNYEAGVKGTFFNDTLRVLASFYIAEWTKQPNGAALFYFTPAGVRTQANVTVGSGGTDAMGTEWEVLWQPIDGLSVDGTFAWNKTEIVSTVCAACRVITGNSNPVGARVGRFPGTTASLGATYRRPVSTTLEGYFRVDANYQGREYADITNLVWLDPYIMSNARIGIESDHYKLEFYVLNLFDNDTPQSIAQTTEQIGGRQTITVTPALKRTFGLRAGVKF